MHADRHVGNPRPAFIHNLTAIDHGFFKHQWYRPVISYAKIIKVGPHPAVFLDPHQVLTRFIAHRREGHVAKAVGLPAPREVDALGIDRDIRTFKRTPLRINHPQSNRVLVDKIIRSPGRVGGLKTHPHQFERADALKPRAGADRHRSERVGGQKAGPRLHFDLPRIDAKRA